jgi:membrane protein implicated in regulation of membrane protease activity
MQWWHWIVIGLSLCLCELAVPVFVLIWLGLSAIVLGAIVWLVPLHLTSQLLSWALLSTFLVYLWQRVFRDKYPRKVASADMAVGEIGLLVRSLLPFQVGEVLFQRPVMGSDRWACMCEVKLQAGTRVRVVKIEGAMAIVCAA